MEKSNLKNTIKNISKPVLRKTLGLSGVWITTIFFFFDLLWSVAIEPYIDEKKASKKADLKTDALKHALSWPKVYGESRIQTYIRKRNAFMKAGTSSPPAIIRKTKKDRVRVTQEGPKIV